MGIGESLYAGIMTDTGSFRHPSTSRNVHLIIAELLDAGIDLSVRAPPHLRLALRNAPALPGLRAEG